MSGSEVETHSTARKKLLQQPGPYAGGLAALVLLLFQDMKSDLRDGAKRQSELHERVVAMAANTEAKSVIAAKDVSSLDERLRRIENAVQRLPELEAQVRQLAANAERAR